ncbi:hypothetical protein cypCar_00037296 [Cyprinus carpio]|nr:hypothetical protein cypCar_00037296 [Cyprinus carpio]
MGYRAEQGEKSSGGKRLTVPMWLGFFKACPFGALGLSTWSNAAHLSQQCTLDKTRLKMGCFTFVKVVMVVFNLLICLAGMCLAAAGIWVTVDGDSFMKVLPPFTDDFQRYVSVGIFSITTGAVMTLLGLLGCCGAQKESKCLLIMFFSIILIICIAETAAAIVALVYSSYVSLARNH